MVMRQELEHAVADLTRLDPRIVRMANMPEDRLTEIFTRANRRRELCDKIYRYGVVYCGVPAIGSWVLGTLFIKNQQLYSAMSLPMVVPVVSMFVHEMLSPRFIQERAEIERMALDRAAARHDAEHGPS
jgi:hypothetical protein